MDKQCWFCKNTEDFFLEQKDELLKSIEKELSECESFEKSIVEVTKEKLGFTEENKSKVQQIQKEYTDMTLNAVLENRNNFVKLEPNLSIVLDYYSKYGNRNCKSVRDVIEQYLSEPLEVRYKSDLLQNTSKKERLLRQKTELENVKTFFFEKEITSENFDAGVSQLKSNKSELERMSGNSWKRQFNSDNDNFNFSFRNLGLKFSKKIYICPICLSMFLESSNFSLNVMKGIKDAQMAADWDYDDDDFE